MRHRPTEDLAFPWKVVLQSSTAAVDSPKDTRVYGENAWHQHLRDVLVDGEASSSLTLSKWPVLLELPENADTHVEAGCYDVFDQ